MIKKRIVILICAAILVLMPVGPQASAAVEAPVRLPIVMYHQVKYNGLGKDVISPYEFESDLLYLKRHGYTTVTVGDLLAYSDGLSELPPKPIMLTFDDGYLSTYTFALPLLKKYNAKIVLSLIVKNTDDFTKIPDHHLDYSHVTWTQLRDMLDTGLVEVQNHTYALHQITKARYGCAPKDGESFQEYEKLLAADVLRAQAEIQAMTGQTPAAFAYPYGKYSDSTDAVLRELGFRATFSCRYGINTLHRSEEADLFRLKRLCRSHGEPLSKLLETAYKIYHL